MLVVSISLGNLSILVREYDCLEYSNKEGPSLKRETGIKCMRKNIFKKGNKMVCTGYKMCRRVKMN